MTRYEIGLGENVIRLLDGLLVSRQASHRGDVIRRALASYAYLTNHCRDENCKVALVNSDEQIVKYVELP